MSGQLFVVATPIGNREDITIRAVRILKQVDYIAAEDTRHSRKLCEAHDITSPLLPFHQHNEVTQTALLIKMLLEGRHIALISDAGTPLISDPGHVLIEKAHAHAIRVVPIPGACAAISALSVSGIATHNFTFFGFLPPKLHTRRHMLMRLVTVSRTLIFYEAPHRLRATLCDFLDVFGEARKIALCKEMTKRFEKIHCDTLQGAVAWLESQGGGAEKAVKGEWVLVLEGKAGNALESDRYTAEEVGQIMGVLLENLPPGRAAAVAARITGQPRAQLYKLIQALNWHA